MPVNAALIDDYLGGLLATRHLLAQGYRQVAHLIGPAHLPIYRQRRLGHYQPCARLAGRRAPGW